jgi:CDP-diacylglycerol--glycerol-3-phosphate 3-phosphatidyltransferase
MSAEPVLKRSIVLHGVLFFLVQGALMVIVTVAYHMGWQRLVLFAAISAAYVGGLTLILVVRSGDFRIEGASAPLTRVNLSNTLTFGRLTSIPVLIFMIMQSTSYPILPVTLPLICVVFSTDFLDGIVARTRREITFVGRYLDSSSDYLMIIAVSILFFYLELIPLWFFVLILARLVLFAVGMTILTLRQGKANPLSTFLGKASIFALMVLYVLEIAGLFGVRYIGSDVVVEVVMYVVAVVVAASFVDKALFLRKMFSETPRRQQRRSS